ILDGRRVGRREAGQYAPRSLPAFREGLRRRPLSGVAADPAQYEPADAGVLGGESERGERAHRVADQIGYLEPEVVEQGGNVVHHRSVLVRAGIVRLVRSAVAPGVEADDTPAAVEQNLPDPRPAPVALRAGGEAVEEHGGRPVALVEVEEPRAVEAHEGRH